MGGNQRLGLLVLECPFSQVDSGLEPSTLRSRCPNFPPREDCPLQKFMPHASPKILATKRKRAFTVGRVPSRKHREDAPGIFCLSEVSRGDG